MSMALLGRWGLCAMQAPAGFTQGSLGIGASPVPPAQVAPAPAIPNPSSVLQPRTPSLMSSRSPTMMPRRSGATSRAASGQSMAAAGEQVWTPAAVLSPAGWGWGPWLD